ncbi:Uncharacterised protein [Candidatus Tiddalikarchaeum anstoanum]|nr:Uncharacterised protein [Candidatus Tiddalikarchaeum anstoanum]
MILFASIILMMFLEARTISFVSKLFFLSCIFLVFYFSSVIAKGVFILTFFGTEVVATFSIFFLICSIALMLLSSMALKHESAVLDNAMLTFVVFIPLILYAVWMLVDNSSISTMLSSGYTPLKIFIISYVYIYCAMIFYNGFSAVSNVLTVKYKFISFIGGIFIVFTSSGLKTVNFMPEFTGLFSLFGSFIACIGLLLDSSLALYGKSFSILLDNLKGIQRLKFSKYLQSLFKKDKRLVAEVRDDYVFVRDSVSIENTEEKKIYEKILLSALRWYRRNVKGASKKIKELKQFYNKQVFLTRKLNEMLI